MLIKEFIERFPQEATGADLVAAMFVAIFLLAGIGSLIRDFFR